MPHRELISDNGRYLLAQQGDGNVVVYERRPDGSLVRAVWDMRSHEKRVATDGGEVPLPPAPPLPPQPPPTRPDGAGIEELATSQVVRPRLTRDQMRAVVPADPGPFNMPGYGTRMIRLTNEGTGKVHPLGMAYWPVVNNHAGHPDLRVFLSVDGSLALLKVDKATGRVTSAGRLPFQGTGEDCYWSLTDPHRLYVPQGQQLTFYDVATTESGAAFTAPAPIKQCHSSADGTVHSMTLDGSAAVWHAHDLHRFPSPGGYDECQIDKSGRYLLIKEGDGDNRIVDLHTGQKWTITNNQGAVGHSDMGWEYMVGEDDQAQPGGVFRLWIFTPNGPVDGGAVYHTDWTGMTRYVSHCNSKPGRPEDQIVLFSSSHNGDVARANELVVGYLNCSLRCRSIAPNLTVLASEDYWQKTRANICPVGEWACLTGNLGTGRVDAFLVELPV